MKFFTITITLIITLSLLGNLYAQKGYVLTQEDSLFTGDIRLDLSYADKGIQIKLYKDIREAPRIFYSWEVKEYNFRKDTFKILKNVELLDEMVSNIPVLEARILARGKLILYDGFYHVHIYGIQSGNNYKRIPFYLIEDNRGFIVQIKKKNYLEILEKLLSDSPDLLKRVQNKNLKFKDLQKIIVLYNYYKRG